MIESPCKYCSQEDRKKMRDEHHVLSCKSVCEKWIPYDAQQQERNRIILKNKKEYAEIKSAKIEALEKFRK